MLRSSKMYCKGEEANSAKQRKGTAREVGGDPGDGRLGKLRGNTASRNNKHTSVTKLSTL